MRPPLRTGRQLFSFAVYNRDNKLPYTMNQTLDIQWQPRNDLAIDIGYVGNLGRHEIIPIPFNQARIASPTNPIHGAELHLRLQRLAPPGCNPTSNPAPAVHANLHAVDCGDPFGIRAAADSWGCLTDSHDARNI